MIRPFRCSEPLNSPVPQGNAHSIPCYRRLENGCILNKKIGILRLCLEGVKSIVAGCLLVNTKGLNE
jgi:hypothetical protein